MTFLQPAFAYALPLVALPLLIHLLNRLRYRTVPWAATMFLVKATRTSTRRSRLRHILVLVFRTLALLFLVALMGRPLAGGWLGAVASSSPDTVLVLLDRSASMEATEPQRQSSRRSRALASITRAAGVAGRSARFVLFDSVSRAPRELAALDSLDRLAAASPSDTAADIPALLSAAADYAARNRTGRTEIWIASDLQASNWRPGSREWERINAGLGALAPPAVVRVIALGGATRPNVSVALRGVRRAVSDAGKPLLAVSLRLQRSAPDAAALPVALTLNGVRLQAEVSMAGPELVWTRTFEPGLESADGGWGKVELPADGNPRDNVCHFVYGSGGPLPAIVVAENAEAARYLRQAAVAGRGDVPRAALAPAAASSAAWQTAVAAQWQGELPAPAAVGLVTQFVEQGGALLSYAPGREGPGWYGLQWGPAETAPPGKPFRIATWDETDGLLAGTENGEALPVAALEAAQRQGLQVAPAEAAAWHTVARFADGAPFLLERRAGGGRVYACATLPAEGWSTLADGLVLVPMTQRLLELGERRRGDTLAAACGEWQPGPNDGPCLALDGAAEGNPLQDAGAYRCGARRIALNRPAAEDDPEELAADRIAPLLPSVRVQIFAEGDGQGAAKDEQSELWPLCLALALASLMAESAALPRATAARATGSAAAGEQTT